MQKIEYVIDQSKAEKCGDCLLRLGRVLSILSSWEKVIDRSDVASSRV